MPALMVAEHPLLRPACAAEPPYGSADKEANGTSRVESGRGSRIAKAAALVLTLTGVLASLTVFKATSVTSAERVLGNERSVYHKELEGARSHCSAKLGPTEIWKEYRVADLLKYVEEGCKNEAFCHQLFKGSAGGIDGSGLPSLSTDSPDCTAEYVKAFFDTNYPDSAGSRFIERAKPLQGVELAHDHAVSILSEVLWNMEKKYAEQHATAASLGTGPVVPESTSSDIAVMHVRLGDVLEQSHCTRNISTPEDFSGVREKMAEVFEKGLRTVDRTQNWIHNKSYVFPRQYYEQAIEELPKEVRTVVVMSGSMCSHVDPHLIRDVGPVRSLAWQSELRAFLEGKGFRVVLRKADTPDEDLAYMSSARTFIQGGGDFSGLIAELVAKNAVAYADTGPRPRVVNPYRNGFPEGYLDGQVEAVACSSDRCFCKEKEFLKKKSEG